jgi:hypothetical protein
MSHCFCDFRLIPGITAPLYMPRRSTGDSSPSPLPLYALSFNHSAHARESRSRELSKRVSCNAKVSSVERSTANTVARLLRSVLSSL